MRLNNFTRILAGAFIVMIMIISPYALIAQKHVISGKVLAEESFAPVAYVNISIFGTNTGCATDVNGEFAVKADTLPGYLVISHVGYETLRIWLEHAVEGMSILLKPAVKMLNEVEVRSKSEVVPFFMDDNYTVLDYEVRNTLVYLLIYRYGLARPELICKSVNGDTVAVSGRLPFKPVSLFSDCLGYLHVLSADSAYQVFADINTIIFPFRTPLNRFFNTMSDCIASGEDWLYFREESVDKLVVNFYRIHRKTGTKEFLATASDDESLKYLRKNPGDYYFLAMDSLPATPDEIVSYTWVRKILYQPNASVLKKLGDTLALFNTAKFTLNIYNTDGKRLAIYAMPIDQMSGEKWQHEIILDELTRQPFTTFLKGGKMKVYRIDLTSGKLIYKLTTGFVFPEKLRIDNGYLYYMYNQPGINDTKKVYRQKI